MIEKALNKLISDGPVELLISSYKYLKQRISRSPQYIYLRVVTTHRATDHTYMHDPFKIIHVDPQDIERHCTKFDKWSSVGRIEGGAWDNDLCQISQKIKYKAVKNHFCNEVPWEETGIIGHLHSQLREEKRSSVDGCSNRPQLNSRYRQIDNIYEDMKESGYEREKHEKSDCITVHIGRDGELIFAGNGWHRLTMAKILGLDEIPVWVLVRHKEWQKLCDEIYESSSLESLDEDIKPYVHHPDMKEVLREKHC